MSSVSSQLKELSISSICEMIDTCTPGPMLAVVGLDFCYAFVKDLLSHLMLLRLIDTTKLGLVMIEGMGRIGAGTNLKEDLFQVLWSMS
jgi:hypothetical protein